MLNVQFLNFRCFTRSAPVEIRPITVLIGENSAGKSSFLEGLRFIFEEFTGGSQNGFNKEPFFLGGFEEIAHRRPRRLASQFEMNVRNPDDNTAHQFTFIKGEPQPQLSEYTFTWSDHDSVSFSLAGDKPTVTFKFSDIGAGDIPIDLFDNERVFPPAVFLRGNLSYLPIIIDQMRFRVKTASQGNGRKRNTPKLPEDRIAKLEEKFRASTRQLQKNVFASAPVRTQPSRTYTPSEVRASSEGDQVPLELARAKLRSPERWVEIQRNLASFGRDSGLFTDIDIRQFGKSDIDPFQVLVRLGKDRRNIVDVGYGISQVLPIIYPIQMSNIYNTFLLQQPEVHLHPRAQAELGNLIVNRIQVNKHRRPTMFVVETHSDYIIDRLRILIMRQILDPKDVTIVFFSLSR